MQLQPWKIHILGFYSGVKPAKDQIQSLGLRWLNIGLLAFQKEPAQSFVFEASYHVISVTIMVTWVKLPNLITAVRGGRCAQEFALAWSCWPVFCKLRLSRQQFWNGASACAPSSKLRLRVSARHCQVDWVGRST